MVTVLIHSRFTTVNICRAMVLGALSYAAILPVTPCMSASANGTYVKFGGQQNLIIWDENANVEHFIRKPEFQTDGKDFGFIAPTPSVPQIAAADEMAFKTLESLNPKPAPRFGGGGGGFGGGGGTTVEVVQTVDVGQYQAVTLAAQEAGAAAKWLKDNGYDSSPAIEKWIRFYVEKSWYLTAFKYQNPNAKPTTAIRMSFRAERPFNPYYVPEGTEKTAGSSLRLYFVALGKYQATIGENTRWKAPLWHAKLSERAASVLAKQVGLRISDIPARATVTAYQDPTFPNNVKEDLYFRLMSYDLK